MGVDRPALLFVGRGLGHPAWLYSADGYPVGYGRAGSTRRGPPLMDATSDFRPPAASTEWPPGPVVLGVAWEPSDS